MPPWLTISEIWPSLFWLQIINLEYAYVPSPCMPSYIMVMSLFGVQPNWTLFIWNELGPDCWRAFSFINHTYSLAFDLLEWIYIHQSQIYKLLAILYTILHHCFQYGQTLLSVPETKYTWSLYQTIIEITKLCSFKLTQKTLADKGMKALFKLKHILYGSLTNPLTRLKV